MAFEHATGASSPVGFGFAQAVAGLTFVVLVVVAATRRSSKGSGETLQSRSDETKPARGGKSPGGSGASTRRKTAKAASAKVVATLPADEGKDVEEEAHGGTDPELVMNQQLEPWEIPLEPKELDSPPTETEKALLKVVKKLREVKHIEALIIAGDRIVEPNQRAKAARRDELLQEWSRLYADVQFERGNPGCSREFVTVRSGAAVSRPPETVAPRPEASARAQAEAAAEAAARKPKAGKRSRAKGSGKRAGDEDEEWVVVGNDGKPKDKKQPERTEEARVARQAAQQTQRALRVMSTATEEHRLTRDSLKSEPLFSIDECLKIEELIDQVVIDAERGMFKEHTVDLTPMRNKYFFGFAYTYGAQKEHPGAHGVEAVWPPEDTSEIPAWITDIIISRLEARRLVPKGWINSATINDYAAGGCIVSHIDPPHLFDRPILSVSMFSECNLVFGTRFAFPKEAKQDIETSTPVLVQPCPRGYATVLKGYSANKITHAIRPCDLPSRRASIILRRVLPSAPVLVGGKVIPLSEHLKQRGK